LKKNEFENKTRGRIKLKKKKGMKKPKIIRKCEVTVGCNSNHSIERRTKTTRHHKIIVSKPRMAWENREVRSENVVQDQKT